MGLLDTFALDMTERTCTVSANVPIVIPLVYLSMLLSSMRCLGLFSIVPLRTAGMPLTPRRLPFYCAYKPPD
jgi:hypothetical protein